MDYDGSEESEADEQPRSAKSIDKPPSNTSTSEAEEEDEEAGDDFDDFEEGAEVEDFGDFDEGDELEMPPEPAAAEIPVPVSVPEFVSFVISELSHLLSSPILLKRLELPSTTLTSPSGDTRLF
jgi:hypothetical protein